MNATETGAFVGGLLKLLEAVPPVIWSGLLASVVALLGVMVGHWGTSKRFREQLAHDSRQKALDRLSTLRKDLYSRAGDTFVRTSQHLASLNSKASANANLADGLTDFLALSAQISLVATDRTRTLIGTLSIEMSEGLLKLLPEAAPCHREHYLIELADEAVDAAQAEIDSALQGMRQLNDSGVMDIAKFEALQRRFNEASTRMDEQHALRMAAYKRLHAANQHFNRQVQRVIGGFSEIQMEVQIALREEMGLETDREAFREQSRMARRRMRRATAVANKRIFEADAVPDAPVDGRA